MTRAERTTFILTVIVAGFLAACFWLWFSGNNFQVGFDQSPSPSVSAGPSLSVNESFTILPSLKP
jgi:hypothetical protein